MMTVKDVLTDPKLFGNLFDNKSWFNWRALLMGFYGLKLTAKQTTIFSALTGLERGLKAPAKELWLVIGRRGGKSFKAAFLAVYEAFFNDYADKLAPGEVAHVIIISPTQKQSRQVFRYIRGLVDSCPMLAAMVVRETHETLELSNRCVIEVMTASHRSIRGYTVSCAILDEIAYWHIDGANPDSEILAAIRPSLATLGGKLIALSSPYARRGVLYDAYKRYFGKSGDVLVAQAPTALMNPTLPQRVIDDAYAADPIAARAEYGAEFRTDIESYISREALEAVTITDRRELPPSGLIRYAAFVDPSGGSHDAFTMAIGHAEGKTLVIDCLRAVKPPFSPETVVDDLCGTLKDYRIKTVTGDNYAGEWPKEQFSKRGVTYNRSEKNRSDLYRDLLPKINSQLIELPDNKELFNQLAGLERRTSRGGKDRIDHALNQHDDLANAVAGLSDVVLNRRENIISTGLSWGRGGVYRSGQTKTIFVPN